MDEVEMSSGHPDANLLAALSERTLPGAEREQVLAHLAGCADCREVAALTSRSADRPRRTHSHFFGWRVAAAFATVALIVAGTAGIRLALRSTPAATKPLEAAAPPAIEQPAPALASARAEQPAKSPTVPHKAAVRKSFVASAERKLQAGSGSEPAPAIAKPAPGEMRATGRENLLPALPQAAFRKDGLDKTQTERFTLASGSLITPAVAIAWRIHLGRVERSVDSGKIWEPVILDKDVKFSGIAADGMEVWAGGSNGALFHSRDGGSVWVRVAIGDGVRNLTGTIVAIRQPLPSEIVLETEAGEEWLSDDGGLRWRRL